MKEYSIKITQDKGLHIHRMNKGFNILELIGFVEIIKNDLLVQHASMMNQPSEITREFISKATEGTIEVRHKEKNNGM